MLVFPQFRYLQRALFVHGQWYYNRLSTLVQVMYRQPILVNPSMSIQYSHLMELLVKANDSARLAREVMTADKITPHASWLSNLRNG